MKTSWEQDGEQRQVVAPVSLVVTAFAPVADVRASLTPQLRTDAGDSVLILIDLGRGRHRMGGSILAQSRGPILAFIPAMLMVMTVHVWRTRRWRGPLAFVGALVIGVLGATTVLNHQVIQRFGEVSGEIAGFNQHNEVGSVRERIAMWGVAVDAIAEHPLTGVGLNQFGTYAREGIARGE
ncbi:hypothetical protein G6F22_018111 [Rhizopus arrhizus]|nr:hypothetical protein G6F22_018111 [Rhizopus arrhizus]